MKYPTLNTLLAGIEEFDEKLEWNEGAPEAEVKKAAKAAASGDWKDRLIGIAEATQYRLLPYFKMLKDLQEEIGSKPNGIEELANEMTSMMVFNMIDKRGWNRDQIKQIAWGIPLDILEAYDLGDLRSKDQPPGVKENN